MKSRSYSSLLLTMAFAVFTVSNIQAQLISDWFNVKAVDYQQTSAASPTVISGNAYSWEHFFNPNGGDTVVSASVTVPSGTLSPLTMAEDGGEWVISADAGSQAALDAIVGDGIHGMNVTFGTAGAQAGSLDLQNDGTETYFSTVPEITSVSNAVWSGGDLIVTAGTTATINFNGMSESNFTPGTDIVFIGIDGTGGESELGGNTAFGSFTIGSGGDFDLVAGTYEIEIEIANVVDTTTAFGGSAGVAAFSRITGVNLVVTSAVPEPASFALVGGLFALGFGATRRRRRVV
ncbi:MAG: hypothetical protein SynsKO_24210 [Synoicihabitans sp.]